MSAQDYDKLSLLEAFGLAAWGKNPFIKEFTHKSSKSRLDHTIEYLDFGEYLPAVQLFCPAVDNKLVVFQEYRTAMDKFKGDMTYKKGACITGQPGIGKTTFIAYAVIVQLREERPVAIQVPWEESAYLLFTATGVTHYNDHTGLPLRAHPQIWTFSDYNNATLEPCVAFQNARSSIRIFQTTSPAVQHWKEWTKQCTISLYAMDVPSNEDIEDLAVILGKDVQGMNTFSEKWGRVPHTLLWLLESPSREEAFEEKVADAVNKATANPSVVFDATAHNNSTVLGSPTLFFIGPASETTRNITSVYVPTCWLADQLTKGLFRCDEIQRADFFHTMRQYSHPRSTRGWMSERQVNNFQEKHA